MKHALPTGEMKHALPTQEARAALGVRLEGAVLIVDEAHNLVDAVNGAHGAALSRGQLAAAQGQLSAYYERFRTRLAPGNYSLLRRIRALGFELEAGAAVS